MIPSRTHIHRTALIFGSAVFLALSACASVTTPQAEAAPAVTSEKASEQTGMMMHKDIAEMTPAEKDARRAECKAMHEAMMEKKKPGDMHGPMAGHKMTADMKSRHQTCMALMPEMKAKMSEKCAAHKAGHKMHHKMGENGMAHGRMQEGAMSEMCPMMQDDGSAEEGGS